MKCLALFAPVTVAALLLSSCSMHEPPDDEADAVSAINADPTLSYDEAVETIPEADAPAQLEIAEATPARQQVAKEKKAEDAPTAMLEGRSRANLAPAPAGAGAVADAPDSAGSAKLGRYDAVADLDQEESDMTSTRRESVARSPKTIATGTTAAVVAPVGGGGIVQSAPVDMEPVLSSNAEDYTDYGVNGFTMVERDGLSTFSIDVDTASYTIARKKLQDGTLPPWESVRVEEFVNYGKYDYSKPRDAAFAVDMEAMPDPFRAGHHILRVGVQGAEVSRTERPALHLTFLVDVSGSMSDADKLPLAKDSLHMLVDNLREDDTVALATYAGRVAKILDPTPASNKRAIHHAIEQLSSGGSTAMSAGIDIAYDLAWSGFHKGEENRVMVLSDGDANVGNTDWNVMLNDIKGFADKGVTLSTIGFGMGNYKDTLMEQLANKGDGNNFYVDSKDQAQRLFVEQIGGTLLTIARDVKIQVEFNADSVAAYRLVGYENRDIADKDFRNDRVDAGEVGSGHQVTALYEVVLREGYDRDLATVRMRYERPGPDGEATERAFSFPSSALRESTSLTSRDLRIAYTSATFAEVLRQSPYAAEVSLSALARFGEGAVRSNHSQDDRELISLIRTADGLGAVASR